MAFEIIRNNRILADVVGFTFEDLSEIGTGKPYRGGLETTVSLIEGIAVLARQASDHPRYDPRFHRLSKVLLSDGTHTYGFLAWSHYGNLCSVYVQSSTGSPIVTIRFSPNN
jgi:hypothetical protein